MSPVYQFFLKLFGNIYTGDDPEVNVYRYLEHSIYPSGTFDLIFEHPLLHSSSAIPIPWDASSSVFKTLAEAHFTDLGLSLNVIT
jgi:hypothetical protein